jgi:hypothetical protein
MYLLPADFTNVELTSSRTHLRSVDGGKTSALGDADGFTDCVCQTDWGFLDYASEFEEDGEEDDSLQDITEVSEAAMQIDSDCDM